MEFVWVVPRASLFPRAGLHGFLPLPPAELESRFLAPAREEGFFIERRYAEEHPEFKQPIPYVVVRRDFGADEGAQVLALTRLKTQGEKRLHGLRSVGVGGHINPCDQVSPAVDRAPAADRAPAVDRAPAADLFHRACLRELDEELVLPAELPADRLRPLGLLNDDTSEVGAVHLGLVYTLEVDDLPVAIRETGAMEGGFEPLSALAREASADHSPFETWSTLLLRSGALGQLASERAPSIERAVNEHV